MLVLGGSDVGFDFDQFVVSGGEVDDRFRFGGADVAGDVEIVILFVGDLGHLDAGRKAFFFAAVLVRRDDLFQVIVSQTRVRGIGNVDLLRLHWSLRLFQKRFEVAAFE